MQPAAVLPLQAGEGHADPAAIVTKYTDHPAASRKPTACERRVASTRSSSNSASTIKSRTPQSAAVTFIQAAAVRLSAPCTPAYGIDRNRHRVRPGGMELELAVRQPEGNVISRL